MSCKHRLITSSLLLALAVVPATAGAALISQTADDTFNNTSFNTGTRWSDGLPPAAGNDYTNASFLLRTPPDAANYTFAGDSLTITSDQALGAQLNDSLLYKGGGTGSTIIANNFTVNGGAFRHAQGEGQTFVFESNSFTVGPNGMAVHLQGPTIVNAPLHGSGLIRIVDNGSNDNRRTLDLTSNASTYSGNIELPTANRSRLRLTSTGALNFLIGPAGTNNRITGNGVLTLDGTLNIDLTGASTNPGDAWQLISISSLAETYGPTFNIAGFTNNNNGTWSANANGTSYTYVTYTGALMIPEPATLSLLAALPLLARRRRA